MPGRVETPFHLLFLCDLRDFVTQPDTQDASVTLTATISIPGAIDAKAFPIAVRARMTDTQAVAAARAGYRATLQLFRTPADLASHGRGQRHNDRHHHRRLGPLWAESRAWVTLEAESPDA